MSAELEQQLRMMEADSIQLLHTDVHRYAAHADEMMKLSKRAGPVGRALALRVLGNSLRLQGKLPEALQALRRASQNFRRAGDEVEWARTGIGLLPVLVQLGKHRAAMRAVEDGLEMLLKHSQYLPAARLLNNAAAMYGNMGRPVEALERLKLAEEMALKANDEELRVRLSLHKALVLQQLGRHEEAIAACAPPLRLARKTGQMVLQGKVLQAGAIQLLHLGRFGKALRRFAKARAIFEAASSARDVAVLDLYICHCYTELNRYDQALARVRAVLERQSPGSLDFTSASARLYEGIVLVRKGRTQEALRSLEEANLWFERHGHAPWAAKGYMEQAEVFLAKGMARDAVTTATRAGKLFQEAQMPVEEARAQLLQAEAHLSAGREQKAEEVGLKAYTAFRHAAMPAPMFRCLRLLGRTALERGDLEGAVSLLTRAVETAEKMRATVQLAFRESFLDDKSSAYADLVWAYLKLGKVRQAHQLTDRAKSRALVDLLSNPPQRPNDILDQQDRQLWTEMEATRREYQHLVMPIQLGPEEVNLYPGGAGAMAQRRSLVEQRLTALWDEWELRQTARVGAVLGTAERRSRRHVRLGEGEFMVEFFVATTRILAFVSDRRGLRDWVELGSPEGVRRTLELLQLNLDASLVSYGRTPPGLTRNARTLLQDLYRRLWAPLTSLLEPCRHVVVIPHGILHQVPFEALFDGERYLVQNAQLSLAPSREAWVHCMERAFLGMGDGPALVAGYDPDGTIPFVEEEARWVAEALAVRPLLGDAAQSRVLPNLRRTRLIHLAVHGEFRPDNPFFSTLLFADGPLTVNDAVALRLNASLVVLSGCETGLSRVTPGGELLGMISAFLSAGSASVLASRWRVDDQTTHQLMQRFYEGLLGGRGKADALREAQAAMAACEIHPLHWAAFGLVGHSGPLTPNYV